MLTINLSGHFDKSFTVKQGYEYKINDRIVLMEICDTEWKDFKRKYDM